MLEAEVIGNSSCESVWSVHMWIWMLISGVNRLCICFVLKTNTEFQQLLAIQVCQWVWKGTYTHLCPNTCVQNVLHGHLPPVSFISILVPYEDSSNHSQQKVLFTVKWSQTNCPSMLCIFLLSHYQWYACLHIHNIKCNLGVI